MKSKPVIIEYPKDVDGFLKGAIFESPTPAVAKRVHPEAKIVRYSDGETYEEDAPKKTKSKTATKTRTARTRKAATTPPVEVTPEAPQNAVESPTTNETAEQGS